MTGSNRAVDRAEAAGQGNIFDLPADVVPQKELGRTVIEDLGEKIGGARKDLAGSSPRSSGGKTKDNRPTWARRFEVSEIIAGDGIGRWTIRDTRKIDWLGQSRQVGGSQNTFATEQEALDAIPLAAVSMKHRAVPTGAMSKDGEYTYEIWRDINDRKRVKVVNQVFPSRVAAMEYMAKNAQSILETSTTFGEADLPTPDRTSRTGVARRTGDVEGSDFMKSFGLRAVEFGNWNNQIERQEVMNAAYDGLMDLAEVVGIPPKAIGLNGDLALAFGARGQGLSSARAHYERERAVINLTKMNGAGALAHEWFHALDHYFGRQDGKAFSQWRVEEDGTRTFKIKGAESDMASGGFSRVNSGVRQELRDAYKNVMETMFNKAEQYVEDTVKADQFVAKSREDVAERLDSLRKELSEQKDVRYYKRNNKPASAEQLAEFDTVAKKIIDGDALDVEYIQISGSRTATGSRWSNEALEKLNAIYKAVRGRSGFDDKNQGGIMDRLRGEMNRYGQRLKMLADAQSGEQKTKRVPTEFAMDAKELDQGRGENYWTTPHEMAARAFQGYVEDKIAAQGASSPFLNYAPENFGILTPWGAKRPYPYGKEREAINNALDAFVEVLETRETDSGVAMFSRRTGFADKVDMVLDGTLPESTAIGVARSVPVLTALGMPDLPLATTGDRIAKMHFDHGMTRAEIASLEQEIQNPVMVFESDSIPGAKVLVTGMWRDGAPVVAAIRPNVELKRFDVNLLASAYGKDRIEQLGKWNDAGLLRYFDKQKALAWATIGGVQFPWMVQLQQRLPINVIGPADVVKPSFKRGADGSAGVAELQEFADSLTAGWANAPEVVVLNSLDDANTPQAVLRENEAQKSKGANGKPRAFFYDGKVWLVNSQLNDKTDAAEALFHEALGHYGLRGVFGKALSPVLNDLANRRPELMQAKAKEYGLNLSTSEGKLTAAEEVLAELAQTKPEISFIRMAVAAVRTWLRNNVEFFNNLKLTDDEIVRNFIVPARNWVETGKSKKPTIYRDDNQDVNNQDVRFSRGTDKERASFKVEESGKLDNIIYKLQDKNVDLKRVSQAITKQTGELEDTINAYQKESLYHGKAAKQSKDFLDKQLKPLLDEMRARKVNLQEFENYLWNRHAPERNDQIAKVNDRFPDGGSGIKTEDAMRYLKGLPEDKRRHFEALAKRVDQITRDNMQMMVDSGLEKQETIDSMKGAYKHYVPLLRGESSSYDGKGQGYSIRGATTKRALGSDKPVENIISALADQREKIISRSQKAEVGRALMGLALENPQDDFWFVFDPLLNKDEGQRTRLRDQLETMGLDSDLADEISRQPYTEEMGKSGKVIRTPNKRLTELPTALAVRINGEDKYIVFNKDNDRARRMGESLSNLDAPKLDGVLGFVGPITRYFASINTQYNPIFGIVNLVRDVQGALFNLTSTKIAGKQAEVMKGIYPATKGIYQAVRASRTGGIASGEWADLYERFQNVGGQTGFRDMFSTPKERTEKQLKEVLDPSNFQKMYSKSAKWLFDGLSDYNEMLENGVRLSAFKAALDSGLSDEQAASLAKELTVNFNRKGQVGSQMSAGYAFFNASTQGSARLIETLKGPKGKRIITGGILLGVVQTMALAMAGFDDEDPKEFVRERNLIIPTGGGDYLTIPMPLGLHVLPNIGRIITEQLMGRTRKKPIESFASLFGVMVDSFNPMGSGTVLQTAMPTIADPIVALIENKDFTGSNIAREDFNPNKPTPGYTRTKANSIDSLVIVARALNFLTGGSDYTQGLISPTPDQLEYLISQVTGGVGREVSKFVQLGETAISGEELPPYKVPLLGRFYGNTTSQSSQAGQFYENLRAMNDHKLEIKGRLEDGLSTSDYIKDNPEAKIFRQAEAVERRVQELGRTKRKLKDNGAGPESIKQVEESITRVMTGFNEQVKRLRAVKEG